MAFEPEKLFLGVIDLFAVLLPGALLTFFAQDWLGPKLLGDGYDQLEGATAGLAFLVASYLAGHVLFLVGSLLDELVYDRIRTATEDAQVKRFMDGKPLAGRPRLFMARRLIPPYSDEAVRTVVRIKERHLDPLGASGAVNAFQWSKATLSLGHPQAMTAVHRFEADSKFFRSLMVLLGLLLPVVLWEGRLAVAGLVAVLGVLAFWRYIDQRAKSINQAYWFVIASEAAGAEPAAAPTSPRVGIVVCRETDEGRSFMTLSDGAGKPRVLDIDLGRPAESPEQSAVRLALRDGRVWARKAADLGTLVLDVNGDKISVRCFLLCQDRAIPERRVLRRDRKEGRADPPRREWVDLDQACGLAGSSGDLATRLRDGLAAMVPSG